MLVSAENHAKEAESKARSVMIVALDLSLLLCCG